MLLLLPLALANDPAPAMPTDPSVAVVPERGTVVVLKKASPEYPQAARDQGVSVGGCAIRIFFDETGTPYRVVPLQCDEVWVAASVTAGEAFRFAPYVVDGVARKARYDTAFVFALEAKPGTISVGGTMAPPPPTDPPADPK